MRRVHGPLHLWRSLMGAQPRRPPQISQREAELDRVILAGAAHWRTLVRPQKAIHESLEKLWIANDILAKLRQKTATWREPISEEAARELLKDVKSLRHPRVIWSVLRTLWKAWPTSHRCQEEEIKSCVFGCQAEDRFRHYAGCHRLTRIINRATALPRFESIAKATALAGRPAAERQHALLQVAVAGAFFCSAEHDDGDYARTPAGARHLCTIAAAQAHDLGGTSFARSGS